jgi:flagellar secretion chaperone FliS
MANYREHALEGASAVELVVALYDGILRFLYAAGEAVDHGDEVARRAAVKRALDIIIHLQARLRMDVGGRPAQALSEFYASIFAQILKASQSASRQKFEHAIDCVRNVRDAWREVARDTGAVRVGLAAVPSPDRESSPDVEEPAGELAGSRWTA